MKILLFIAINFMLFIVLSFSQVHAIVDPLASPNNKFGIHILEENDIVNATKLVNSSGGKWGYVTLVIRDDQMDTQKWQSIFDQLRVARLIPIVRIATHLENNNWVAPTENDAQKWADFLDSLFWVVKNRYIVIFNEPNHAKEWGGQVNPTSYTKILSIFSKTLKSRSDDYFVLPAGLDCAAPNSFSTMDCGQFWKTMYRTDKAIFSSIDGWTSHSYPNPGFSAPASETGKHSVAGYLWETSFLSRYGLRPNIPVFITETGWERSNTLSDDQIAQKFEYAYSKVWTTSNIVAITPFVLDYSSDPFQDFSWINSDKSPTKTFEKVEKLAKIEGEPVQYQDAIFDSPDLPDTLFSDSEYLFEINLVNRGQGIWNESDGYSLKAIDNDKVIVWISPVEDANPFRESKVFIRVKLKSNLNKTSIKLQMYKDNVGFGEQFNHTFDIVPPPNISIHANTWLSKPISANNFSLTFYNNDHIIQKEINNISLVNGEGNTNLLTDLVPNNEYIVALSKPYYVSSERIFKITTNSFSINFGTMWPIDFTNDKRFTFGDVIEALTHPKKSLDLLRSY